MECERLQTLPDNYTEGVSNTQRYKMIGNGWTVDVVAWVFMPSVIFDERGVGLLMLVKARANSDFTDI